MDVNIVILSGRVVRIYDLKYWPDGTPWMAISLVTEKRFGKDSSAQFHRVVLIGAFAEVIQTHLDPQQEVQIKGELSHRKGSGDTWISEVRVEHSYNFELGPKRRRASDGAADPAASERDGTPPREIAARVAATPQSR